MRGTCTRTSCEYWHPPECQFYKIETGCKAGDKCLFPQYKVDEQPNKKPKKSDFPKRRESDDKNAVAIVKSVPQLGCVSQDSDALVSQGRKSRRSPMQKVLEPIQRVRFTKSTPRFKRVSGKGKDHRLEKIQVKNPHQRSPYAMKFEDQSQEETERQQRCARSKAWNLAKNIYKLKKKTRLHSTFPRRNGYSRLRQQKSQRKESLQWI